MKYIYTTIVFAGLALAGYLYTELSKPLSVEDYNNVILMEMEKECYGDHEFHCVEYYESKLR